MAGVVGFGTAAASVPVFSAGGGGVFPPALTAAAEDIKKHIAVNEASKPKILSSFIWFQYTAIRLVTAKPANRSMFSNYRNVTAG